MRYAIRGFRGTRRSSVYREHLVSATLLMRVVEVAEQKGFPVSASLREDRELNKAEARQLAGELSCLCLVQLAVFAQRGRYRKPLLLRHLDDAHQQRRGNEVLTVDG